MIPRDLDIIDRLGDRDHHWSLAFGFGRELLRTVGRRCLTCGRRLYGASRTRRTYCDETCRNRHSRRRERFREALREMGEACPYCNADQ